MALALSDVDALVVRKLMPGLVDEFFKGGATLAWIKQNRWFRWEGGPQIQEGIIYKPMKGGSYKKGANFDITKQQTKTGMLFDPRTYYTNVTEYKEDIEILVQGSGRVMSMVQADLTDAALTMSAILAVAIFQNGQNVGGNDRTAEINGLEESLTDGINATWNTAAPGFSSYGGITRTDVGTALNSPTGVVSSPNVNGQITYRILEHSYQSVVIGNEHPMIGVTTNRAMGFISENFQPQQIVDTTEPTIGFTGIKFKAATIIADQYCPGADGVNDPNIGNYLASAGETFWWLNPGPAGDGAYLKLYFAPQPSYQFGWTGFKVAQDSTVLAGQILFGGAFVCRAPRLMRALFGILR